MNNPFDPAYLTSSTTQFGTLAWLFFLVQLVAVGAGFYLKFLNEDRKAVRRELLETLGIALMGIGGVGILLAALRLGGVAPFTQRYWFYLLALVEVGVAGYVFYYARSIYPARVAASRASRGKSSPRKAPTTTSTSSAAQLEEQNGAAQTTESSSVATGRSRRAARRERKRRHR